MLCIQKRMKYLRRSSLIKIKAIHKRFKGNHLSPLDVAFNLDHGIDASDDSNWTTLHYAAYLGLDQICTNLLQNGANVNKINAWGDTPLHLACLIDNHSCIGVILNWKPHMNIQNKRFHTPLRIFISRPPQNEYVLNKLLDAGADPNMSDEHGYSALHFLAIQATTAKTQIFTKLMIDYNANVNSLNKFNESPLHMAINDCSEALVEVLVENGASTNIPNDSGKTQMDLAFTFRNRSPGIFNIVAQEIIRQYCCGFSVNLSHMDIVCGVDEYKDFKKLCEEEMLLLKGTFLGQSNVSLRDILVSPTEKVARYLLNPNILNALIDFNLNEYIYGSRLSRNFQEGLKVYHGVELGNRAARKAFPFLPYPCIENITKFLDMNDFRNLDEALT